jgi:bifunctional diaminopimelate decarboxylase / aspartate kinase
MELSNANSSTYPVRSGHVVAKFGGTSVATRAGWDAIAAVADRHLRGGRRVVVVCSAVAGITDQLTGITEIVAAGGDPTARLAEVARVHRQLGTSLGLSDPDRLLAGETESLAAACAAARPLTAAARAAILAHGELMSTRLGTAYLARAGRSVVRLDARRLLAAVADEDRDERYLSARCAPVRGGLRAAVEAAGADVLVTQGFIAGNPAGETVLLGRGGSDTSGAYLAAGLAAEALEIWTDVPGVFTADPRRFPEARLLNRLSYDEAEAVGALGAKVLHPRTIEPARRAGVPIRIGWTARPEVAGTRIVRTRPPRGAKAIVSRRNLALLTMWRPSSWQPVGFMAEVAARFHRLGLSMDLIASSPSEIRATVDLAAFPSARQDLDRLCAELEEVCRPRVLSRVACVSIVGEGVAVDLLARGRGFTAIGGAAVHLVSHAASGQHVSLVVDHEAEAELVAAAHRELLGAAGDDATFGPSWARLRDRADAARAEPEVAVAAVAGQQVCA